MPMVAPSIGGARLRVPRPGDGVPPSGGRRRGRRHRCPGSPAERGGVSDPMHPSPGGHLHGTTSSQAGSCGLIAAAIVIATCVASAIGTTPETTTHTYTGWVARPGDTNDRWHMNVASGSTHQAGAALAQRLLRPQPAAEGSRRRRAGQDLQRHRKPETLQLSARAHAAPTRRWSGRTAATPATRWRPTITANSDPLAAADSAATRRRRAGHGQRRSPTTAIPTATPAPDRRWRTPAHGTASDVGGGRGAVHAGRRLHRRRQLHLPGLRRPRPGRLRWRRRDRDGGAPAAAGGTSGSGGSTDSGSGTGGPGTGVSGGLLPGTTPRPDMINPVTIQLHAGDDSLRARRQPRLHPADAGPEEDRLARDPRRPQRRADRRLPLDHPLRHAPTSSSPTAPTR